MPRRYFIPLLLLISSGIVSQEAIRGMVRIEMEPLYIWNRDVPRPGYDTTIAHTRALQEAQVYFSGMIYGWSFYYDIGERARGIAEEIELEPLGTIEFGDPSLRATDAQFRDASLYVWMDYELNEFQKRRIGAWTAGRARNIQAHGYGPLGGPVEESDWITIKQTALEDAARAGIRAMLRGNERNRPKAVRGFIALAEFPSFWIEAGRWTASARFRVEVQEIIPFSAY